MDDARDSCYWDRRGLMTQMAGVLLPPFAWLLDMQVSYSMVKWACENDGRTILLAIPVVSLTLVSAAAWMAWSSWATIRRHANEEGSGTLDRSYFLAISGLGMSALFALLLLVSIVPRFVLSPCE
jgi:hypothetical protein